MYEIGCEYSIDFQYAYLGPYMACLKECFNGCDYVSVEPGYSICWCLIGSCNSQNLLCNQVASIWISRSRYIHRLLVRGLRGLNKVPSISRTLSSCVDHTTNPPWLPDHATYISCSVGPKDGWRWVDSQHRLEVGFDLAILVSRFR